LAAAVGATVLLAVASCLAFGIETWHAFLQYMSGELQEIAGRRGTLHSGQITEATSMDYSVQTVAIYGR
jgi:hypothetical protein